MDTREINPWTWQDGFGFAHAREVTGATRVLTLSGQCATDATGAPQHPGDMAGQLALAVANPGEVLAAAGMTNETVQCLRVFTTDKRAGRTVPCLGEGADQRAWGLDNRVIDRAEIDRIAPYPSDRVIAAALCRWRARPTPAPLAPRSPAPRRSAGHRSVPEPRSPA